MDFAIPAEQRLQIDWSFAYSAGIFHTKIRSRCELRPRIERNDCTFGRRLPCGHSPEATFAKCSLCARMLALCGLRPRIERDAGDFVVLRGHLPQSGSLLESTFAKCSLCSRTLALFLKIRLRLMNMPLTLYSHKQASVVRVSDIFNR